MKKRTIYILSVITLFCMAISCKQQKSLQEMLQEEKKAIEQYINRNSLVILKNYPKDGVFKASEYYRTDEGLFIHVVDSGNGTRVRFRDNVTVRFESLQYVKDAARGDTTSIVRPMLYYPFSFVYGISLTYNVSGSPMCSGWVIPLSYVGEGAVLDLIIPSSLGSSGDKANIDPILYKNLCYTSFN